MGSNPVEVPKLFFGLICNCLNCDYHCSHDQIFIQNLYLESKVQDFLGFPYMGRIVQGVKTIRLSSVLYKTGNT